jgi:hypothetical protein
MRTVPNFIEPEYTYEARQEYWYRPFKNKARRYKGKKYRRPKVIMLETGMIIDGYYMENLPW